MRSLLIPAMLVFAGVITAATSPAQIAGPCNETVRKYCSDVVPGGGRIVKCLDEHRDDQSIACKDWLEDLQKNLDEMTDACREEIVKLCSIDTPDKVLIYQCLNNNYVSLKLDCRSKLREIKDRLK